MPAIHEHDHAAAAAAAIDPVPVSGLVKIDGAVPVVEVPADYGAYFTIVFTGTEDKRLLLPYDKHRARAYITCTGTGPVWVGSEAQCAAVKLGNTAGGGFQLASGITLPVMHREQVWIIPDGSHTATVSVAAERWDGDR